MEKELCPTEDELKEREEKCRKALKTVGKAIFMRLFVTALLVWIVIQNGMEFWVMGLMLFVLLINLGGLLPLCGELKKRILELRSIMDQYN